MDDAGNSKVVECLNYDLSLQLLESIQDKGGLPRMRDVQAVAAPGGMGDHDVLIGLDLLSAFILTANWSQAWFDLSLPDSTA